MFGDRTTKLEHRVSALELNSNNGGYLVFIFSLFIILAAIYLTLYFLAVAALFMPAYFGWRYRKYLKAKSAPWLIAFVLIITAGEVGLGELFWFEYTIKVGTFEFYTNYLTWLGVVNFISGKTLLAFAKR